MKNIELKIIRKIDSKNRIVLPKAAIKAAKTDKYYLIFYNNGRIELEPVKTGGK